MMEPYQIERLCSNCFGWSNIRICRCMQGIGNYVFRLEQDGVQFSLRCSRQADAYQATTYWLTQLNKAGIPVPKVLSSGCFEDWQYLLLTWLDGEDLGIVYPSLTREQKRQIAKDVETLQQRAATLPLEIPTAWCWQQEVESLLDRAEQRIRQNGYFDPEKINRLRQAGLSLHSYFQNIVPVAYLDDISSKNLLIYEGQVSGVIDVDWIGVGDRLTYLALTRMALLDLQYDTEYVDFLLAEFLPNALQRKAFQFYSLLYCVDFMGERGMQFLDKRVPVSPEIVDKLNGIFDILWQEWLEM